MTRTLDCCEPLSDNDRMRTSILVPTASGFNKSHSLRCGILLWCNLHLENSACPSNIYMSPDFRSDLVEKRAIYVLPDEP
jgi:hypothetical protein